MNHENTRIHSKTLELIRLTKALVAALPAGHADLTNQVRRATESIALNFAEGCGQTTPKQRARYFKTARASANEVSMVFDVAYALGVIDPDLCDKGKDVCDHLGAMLYKFR